MNKKIVLAALAILAAALFTTSCEDVTKSIEDPAFAEWCRTNLDANHNGHISAKEAAAVEEIVITDCGVNSLKGLDIFPNLQTLDCRYNNLTDLDLSGNRNLVKLDCQFNKLATLTFSKADIENLACSNNSITDLDVTALKNLKALFCGSNAMETLTLGEKPELKTLACFDNRLKELDLTACPLLETLDCRANELESLDLSCNPCLTRTLGLSYNNITVIDLSANKALGGVDVDKTVTIKGVSSETEVSRH